MSKITIQITSRDNQKLKNARKIRDGKDGKLIFIEGLRVCEEAVRSRLIVRQCLTVRDFAASERGKKLLDNPALEHCEMYELADGVFRTIADTKTSQGIIFIAEKPSGVLRNLEIVNSGAGQLFVFLYEINNPSNLGAILRTAEAAGVSGIIVSRNSADLFSQKSIRAALGANFRLPFWTNAGFDEAYEWAVKNNLTTVAADIRSARKYTDVDWKMPKLLIFGSEAQGLSSQTLEKIDEKIYIPMENDVESLNLAVSCGVILFEWKNKRF